MEKRKFKQMGILVTSSIISMLSVVQGEVSKITDSKTNINRTVNINDLYDSEELNFKKIVKDILDALENLYRQNYGGRIVDSFVLEKHQGYYVSIWIKSNGKYFVHIYDKHSNHKGTNIFNVCEEIIDFYKNEVSLDIYKLTNDRPKKSAFAIHESLFKILNFSYSFTQPDIGLLKLIMKEEYVHLIVNRGWPKYGKSYISAEPNFLKDFPDFKKFCWPIKDNFEFSGFEILKNN